MCGLRDDFPQVGPARSQEPPELAMRWCTASHLAVTVGELTAVMSDSRLALEGVRSASPSAAAASGASAGSGSGSGA